LRVIPVDGSGEMNEHQDSRWTELAGLRDELDQENLALPIRRSGIDGSRIEASPRAVSFARALAIDARWSGISDARRRHNDLAA
jgi:hypothetical protein